MEHENGFTQEIIGAGEWMRDYSGNTVSPEGAIEILREEDVNDYCYEVYVDIHTSTGVVIHTRNRCAESFFSQMYKGDDIVVHDGFVEINYEDVNNNFHQVRIRVEDIKMLDMWTEEVDWESYLKNK